MKEIKGYVNYGVLAHEKQKIFTVSNPHIHAQVSDKIKIFIPADWQISENVFGEIIITGLDGVDYMADEILSSYDDFPVLAWYDGQNSHRLKLDFVEI